MNPNQSDFLIIGSGIMGLSIADQLTKRFPQKRITVIDKESQPGFHASSRNSGVLHAGFYYSADSLKAKFTLQGNQYWTRYCDQHQLKIRKCGKIVVTKNESELPALNELFVRAQKNQVELQELTWDQARHIEPRVLTHHRAAWSPKTSVIDPKQLIHHLTQKLMQQGVKFFFETQYQRYENKVIITNRGTYQADFIINAAGLYADQVAHDFGLAKPYRILPFKGLYLYCKDQGPRLKTHIYPVPNLKNPFLGVHHTVTVDGGSKIGPTAIPALWREQYQGWQGFSAAELMQILADEIRLFWSAGFDFRRLAIEELQKYNRHKLVSEGSHMLTGVLPSDYLQWGKAGIRAQLFHTELRTLEMDFRIESNANSLHVLNAVSPALTCAPAFAEYICHQI